MVPPKGRVKGYGPPDPERGRRLVEARQRAGLHQNEVATSISVNRNTLRSWEAGKFIPADALTAMAALYKVSEDTLRHGDGTTVPLKVLPAWTQWARERWAEVQVELVRDGADDDALTLLRTFVLHPSLLDSGLSDPELRIDIEAGVAAAKAWLAARRRPVK